MNDLFSSERTVETYTAEELVLWTQGTAKGRLFLPPIQRSLVWRNSQIINYWDSLLRGYPSSMMMVHRSLSRARTLAGETMDAGANDFDLFDGQQRLTTILLGYGVGALSNRLRLWVDLAAEPGTGLLFPLRINKHRPAIRLSVFLAE